MLSKAVITFGASHKIHFLYMTTVECFAAHGAGQPLEMWSYDVPTITPKGCVDVAITHCGVCHSDLHQLEDAWSVMINKTHNSLCFHDLLVCGSLIYIYSRGIATFPLVPGHEIVGKIVSGVLPKF